MKTLFKITNNFVVVAPPSYEESYHTARNDINEDEQHALDRCEFTPLYPVFDIPSPTLDEIPKNQGIFNKSFIP